MVNWSEQFADRAIRMRPSALREILKIAQQPDIISFAGGLPAPEFFPVERIQEAVDTVLSERGQYALQYSPSEGMPELRDAIAKRMSNHHLTVTSDHILIVNGSQQALDLVARVLLNDGDRVAVEVPTYLGALIAWLPYDLDYLTMPTDADGVVVDQVEDVLRQIPKLVYIIPTFQNPQGTTLTLERRQKLVELIGQYDLPVLEDNPYGELRYSGDALPSLAELDAQNMGIGALEGHIIYAGTFSKTLSPGMRIGWVAGPVELIRKVVQAKQGADLHVSTFTQLVAAEIVGSDFFDHHIDKLREVYKERMELMLAEMETHFPEEARWAKPQGGLFLMVYLPEHIDTQELFEEALKYKVAFVPGADFHTGGTGKNTMRLNFSNAKPDQIREGIKRLGALLKEAIKQPV